MSYEAAVFVSILRSLFAGLFCVGLARVLVTWRAKARHDQPKFDEQSSPGVPLTVARCPDTVCRLLSFARPKHLTSILLLVPFFMPGLVVGYAYRNAALSLVQTPFLNEFLYFAIVVSQLTPVAVLALEWLPPAALSPSGIFCLDLLTPKTRDTSWKLWQRTLLVGELPRHLTAGAVVALLCFQEVEVATLMQAQGWAEWIFTKQAGGVEIVEVGRSLILPVLYGLGLVVPIAAFWIARSNGSHSLKTSQLTASESSARRSPHPCLAWTTLATIWLLTVIWPVISLATGAWRGAGVLQLRSAIWWEIGDALILAVTVTSLLGGMMWSLGQRLVLAGTAQQAKRPVVHHAAMIVVLLPGLLGSLALGLLLFEICQHIGWQPAYTPVPLVLGMVLFLLPRAFVLRAMMRWGEMQTDIYLAQALTHHPDNRGRWGMALLWQLRDAGRFWTLVLLFWWSYLELTLPSLLRPAGMAPAPMRLYNFLHYGHIPGLAAMLVLVLAVPLVLLLVTHHWLSRPVRTTWR